MLLAIDELDDDACGALIFERDGVGMGTVLVESGRVCCAFVPDFRERLTDLLCHQLTPALDRRDVLAVYSFCESTRLPLAEVFVQRGLLTNSQVRSAFRQYSAEGIAVIGSHQNTHRFLPHKAGGYSAAVSFSTAEILASLGALQEPEITALARQEIRRIAPEGVFALAFIRERGATPQLVGVVEPDKIRASDANELVRSMSNMLDIGGAIDPDAQMIACTDQEGRACVAWFRAGVVYACVCEDSRRLARCLAALTGSASSR